MHEWDNEDSLSIRRIWGARKILTDREINYGISSKSDTGHTGLRRWNEKGHWKDLSTASEHLFTSLGGIR
jgi:hypothetical protein